jgi:hypothetical protein
LNIYHVEFRGTILLFAVVFCVSAPETPPPEPAALLPLASGWSTTGEVTNESACRLESMTTMESLEKIPCRVAERIYREDTGTAFVLLELDL